MSKKTRKTAIIAAVTMLASGCVSALGAYDFYFLTKPNMDYTKSAVIQKVINTNYAYFQVTYCDKNAGTSVFRVWDATNSKNASIDCRVDTTDRSKHQISYYSSYVNVGANMQLMYKFQGTGAPITISGNWNPNG